MNNLYIFYIILYEFYWYEDEFHTCYVNSVAICLRLIRSTGEKSPLFFVKDKIVYNEK